MTTTLELAAPHHRRARSWRVFALAFLLALAGAVGLVRAQRADAVVCTNSWDGGAGSWFVAANWSLDTVPTAADDVCITAPGTYTVSVQGSAQAKSLQLGGAAGLQELAIIGTGCTGPGLLTLEEPSTIDVNGQMTLTSVSCSGENARLDSRKLLTNNGRIQVDVGTGGARRLSSAITNLGTVAINATTQFDKPRLFANKGPVEIADGVELRVNPGGGGATFHNQSGGSVDSTGGSETGQLHLLAGNVYRQGAGTTDGMPVLLDSSLVDYASGGGASSVVARGVGSTISGPMIDTDQSYRLEGVGCTGPSTTTLQNSMINAGNITMTAILCSGNGATLSIPTGRTLTNTGVLQSDVGTGGGRAINGAVTNDGGAVHINATTTMNSATAYDNRGLTDFAASAELQVPAATGGTVKNGTGGSFVANGGGPTGLHLFGGNTYEQGAGTTTGAAVLAESSLVTYTGAGASTVIARGVGSTLSGAAMAAGQTLRIEGRGCVGPAVETLQNSMSSAGTIVLSAIECGGNGATLVIPDGSTLTSTGTLQSDVGTGGARSVNGAVVNQGTVVVNATTSLGAQETFTNQGAVQVADAVELQVDPGGGGGSFENLAGGSITSSGDSQTGRLHLLSGNTYRQGDGTTTGQSVLAEASLVDYTGSGGSAVTQRGTGSTLSGASIAAGQTLSIVGRGCVGGAEVTLQNSMASAGTIVLSAVECSGNQATLQIPNGRTLTSTGVIQSDVGTGGGRAINGDVTNEGGAVHINTTTVYGVADDPVLFINRGLVDFANSAELQMPQATVGTFRNASGGSVVATNGGNTGLHLFPGNFYEQGAGDTAGAAVLLEGSTVNYTGNGNSNVISRLSSGHVGGAKIFPSQTLRLEGVGCTSFTEVTLNNNMINDGTIVLSSVACSGNTTQLSIPAGTTLTNTGLIQTEAGTGGARNIVGDIVNEKNLKIDVSTTYTPFTLFHNMGKVTVAAATTLTVATQPSSVFFNDTGGQIVSNGTMQVSSGNTYKQGAGRTSGNPVVVQDAKTEYVGNGSSSVIARGTGGTIKGTIGSRQSFTIEGVGCTGPATVTSATKLRNNGTLTLTAIACSGNTATLDMAPGKTFTNAGTLLALTGTGGSRIIDGNVVNIGTIGPNNKQHLTVNGNLTLAPAGVVNAAVNGGTSDRIIVNGAATVDGTLQVTPVDGFVPSSGNAFTPVERQGGCGCPLIVGNFATVTAGWTSANVGGNSIVATFT